LTFYIHEYFSYEDLDLNNPTKFSLYFSYFFYIFLQFYKASSHLNKINKTLNPKPRADSRAPHVSGSQPSPSSILPVPWPWLWPRAGMAVAAAHRVPVAERQGGRGAGRRDAQGSSAAPGRRGGASAPAAPESAGKEVGEG
jgi:hypothetical protein